MSSISYSSGSDMAASVLGGAFCQDARDVTDATKIKYEGTNFIKDRNGELTAGGRVGTTSIMARFKANAETANNNRVTYQAIQDQLSSNHPEVAQAFGNSFWFSKIMGKPITKGAVVSFLDQQIKKQDEQSNAQRGQGPKTSIFARLFGSFFETLDPIKKSQQDTQKTEQVSQKKIEETTNKTAASNIQRAEIRQQRNNANLKSLANMVCLKTYPDFNTYTHNLGRLNSGEKSIIQSLSEKAQGDLNFSLKLNKCFNGTSDSIANAKNEKEKKAAIETELTTLYKEAQKATA